MADPGAARCLLDVSGGLANLAMEDVSFVCVAAEASATGVVLLALRGVTKDPSQVGRADGGFMHLATGLRFGDSFRAVDAVTLDVSRGECLTGVVQAAMAPSRSTHCNPKAGWRPR